MANPSTHNRMPTYVGVSNFGYREGGGRRKGEEGGGRGSEEEGGGRRRKEEGGRRKKVNE